jgi:2-(1,2-epoxy-1,2-dihydrophenyl)acetyl-CoA isomerase
VQTLAYEVREGVGVISFNRPERHNAMDLAMRTGLAELVGLASHDLAVRCIVLRGEGRSFCSGADISGFPVGKRFQDTWLRAHPEQLPMSLMQRADAPIICALKGAVVGAGLSLALAADLRVADTTTKISAPQAQFGLIPDWGLTYFLPRMLGMERALRFVLTGERLDAHEAQRLGLVGEVVEPDELDERVMSLARTIACGPSMAISLSKSLLRRGLDRDLDNTIEAEYAALERCIQTADAAEAVTAFGEKRPAVFKGQ